MCETPFCWTLPPYWCFSRPELTFSRGSYDPLLEIVKKNQHIKRNRIDKIDKQKEKRKTEGVLA
jgi:hypothetical protein